MTAEEIAVAIVAACAETGADPATVFENRRGHRRTRQMAAAACMKPFGLKAAAAGRVFRVDAKLLAPSSLKAADIGDDARGAIAAALSVAGMVRPAAPAKVRRAAGLRGVRVRKNAPVAKAAPVRVSRAPIGMPSAPRVIRAAMEPVGASA